MEGPSRGIFRDCEIFANLRLKLHAKGHRTGEATHLHKAMLASVLRVAGVGVKLLAEADTVIVAGAAGPELEAAVAALYLELDPRPLLGLLASVTAPLLKGEEPQQTQQEDTRGRGQDAGVTMLEDIDLNVTEMLQCSLVQDPRPIRPKPVKIEPKPESLEPPHKKRIKRLPPKESLSSKQFSGRKKFRIQCPHCEMIITGKKSYKRHLRNSHQMLMPRDGEEVQCQVCGKTLKHMQILKTHMKEVHGDRSFTCNLCGLTLSCQRNLNTHMISHTTPSIPCDQCGKLFKRKYAVKNHIKKFHMQIKEKMCDQCDKSFADARHLREHVLAIHDKLKPFGCEVCDFKCARIDNLNTHRKKSHGLVNKLTRAEHDDWVLQGKHPFVKSIIGGADAKSMI